MDLLLEAYSIFNDAITVTLPPRKQTPIIRIEVQEAEDNENWRFVPIKDEKGYHVAVF